MQGISRLALLAALAATPLASPAAAQDNEYQNLGEIVLSALRTASERLRTGVSVSVVQEEDLTAARDTSLIDTLSRLAGVTVSRSGPYGAAATLRIRGADDRYLAVLVDGIRVSDPSRITVSYDWGSLMASDIDRVEVLRGSQSALWGGSAVGGVVSISTLGDLEEGLHQTVQTEAGSYDTAKLSYGITQKDDRAELSFRASRLSTKGFSAAADGTEADGADSARLSFSARYRLSDTLTLGASAFWQDTDIDYDGYVAGTLGDTDYTQQTTETGTRVFADLEAGQTTHTFDLSIFEVDRQIDESGTISAFNGKRTSAGWQASTEISDAFGLVYGADWTLEEARYSNLPGGIADTENRGLFAQALWAPSEALDLSFALRQDDNSAFGGFTTGRASLAWQTAPGTTLRAAVATGFRAPSVDELYGDYPDDDYPFAGNPALTPEESLSYELGVEHSFASGATVSVAAFRLEIENLIKYSSCPATDPTPPAWDFTCAPGTFSTLENLPGVSTNQGVEVAASVPLSEAWDMGLAYTYTDGRDPAGERLVRVPYHHLTLTLDGNLSESLSVGLALKHVAGRLDQAADFSGVKQMEDYTVLDAVLSYDVNEMTEAYLKVENLTDTTYQELDGFAMPGRSVYLGLQAKF